MAQQQKESLAKSLAEIASIALTWNNDPLDGDETEEIAKLFLKELDKLQGNV